MPHPVAHGNAAQVGKQPNPGRISEKTSALPLLLSPTEAARQLGLSRYTTYQLIKSGQLRARRFSRLLLIPRAEVERFAASLEEK
jgi:excisionase family DNA binding protein